MKSIISFFMIICFAQLSDAQDNFYTKQWQDVQMLENEGLTSSASKLVALISERAEKDNNSSQQIKALFYQSKYALILEEDAQLTIIETFISKIDNSDIVTKHVLENLLATMYWQYFQQNRYKFYNRSITSEKIDNDFRTWDLETLFHEIHIYYQRSLENGILLQQESLESYNEIIIGINNSKSLRPTLYDLLSHNALTFYKTDENSITRPSYQFELDNLDYLSDAKTFMNLKLESRDTLSLQYNALKIYQNLLKFHFDQNINAPFVDVDIERLNFIYHHTTNSEKTDALLATLTAQTDELDSSVLSGFYQFEIAKLYKLLGNTYNSRTIPEEDDYRWHLKMAISQCDDVINAHPESRAAQLCKILKKQIEFPSLSLEAERFIPVNSYSRIFITYSNLDNLNFKIFKIRADQLKAYNNIYNVNDQKQFLKNLLPSLVWDAHLPNENDFQKHSTEITQSQISNGIYIVLAQTDEDDVFATAVIQSSDLALIESNENKLDSYQLIDRNNGNPKANALVEMKYRKNNAKRELSKSFTTDRYGRFYVYKDNSIYRDVYFDVMHQSDKAYFGRYFINKDYDTKANTDTKYRSFVFTDRSIYRPGQTVYFKGILSQYKDEVSRVASDLNLNVTMHNVNGEKLSEQQFVTNDYGSFYGEFMLPNDGLTGQFYITVQAEKLGRDNTYFSVEEYKRPKFEASFQPVKELFKVNDNVSIRGEAMAFAGSNITDAKVVYRVVRSVNYPSWYYWRRPAYFSQSQEITKGETQTDSNGEFNIVFKAIPDSKADRKNLPVFHYEITADITDVNGETRSAVTTVNVGYHAMIANIILSGNIDKAKKTKEISIDTRNLNGEIVDAQGNIKIYKLIAPKTPLRPRPWLAPDYQEINEETFNNLFPNESYKNEHLLQNWERGKIVYNSNFDTNTSKTILLKNIKKWQSGKYIIILESKDKFGQDVKAESYVTVFDLKDKLPSDNELFSVRTNKNSYEPKDKAILTFASAAKISVTVDIEKEGKIIKTYLLALDNSKKTIELPITPSDLGGFVIHYSYAAFNYFQTNSQLISVPYLKTDLQIETTTFRDKLLPGQTETWSFKIKGPKGDKVTAELLASMYDASLDQFNPHNWYFNPMPDMTYYEEIYKNGSNSFGNLDFRLFNRFKRAPNLPYNVYEQFNWFGFYFGQYNKKMMRSLSGQVSGVDIVEDASSLDEVVVTGMASPEKSMKDEIEGDLEAPLTSKPDGQTIKTNENEIQVRTNLKETAFFFPQLQTDAEGNVSFNFTAPEALTRWKLQLLAHTKNLESEITQLETVTQKELMVIPNAPRFLREGDEITISTKIANLTENELLGITTLSLSDAVTGKSIDSLLSNTNQSVNFKVGSKGNAQASWTLKIPNYIQAVQYKITAISGAFSDGEQSALPVLSNRMLVTETLPMWVRSNQSKTFVLEKLRDNASTTLNNHKLTLEMTSNPAWYAVQALPYLMEYPYDCNEQTFARYYSNALAQHIVKSNPRIEAVFNQWKSQDALLSNLEKNTELKSILIQETPWLRDAQSETEQKKRIALLFDLNRMTNELQSALRKLSINQYASGAWPWFNGGRDNRYITQHIVSGFGHLKQLGVTSNTDATAQMVKKAIGYLDAKFIEEFKNITKYNSKADLKKDHLSYMQLHYLYVRSFYPEVERSSEVNSIMDYYKDQIKTYWLKRSLYAKGLMALSMHRLDDSKTSNKILRSLKENSINSEELGMYWKANTSSWHWYQAPIETQALLIEAFSEIENDIKTIDNLKIWLLKNKQTNRWSTTKATTEAVYALLLQGGDWLSVTNAVEVTIGKNKVMPSQLDNVTVEAGTGYYKTSWNGSSITPEMATVSITKKNEGIAWGALYWQYFEDLDKISSAITPLQLKKKLFLKTYTDKGEVITEITPNTTLKVGDLVRVRIELRSDRDMEYLHLKDLRAAGFEPVNVISQYKWQDGLGYYESTKDAATNFFIDYLPKGIYIFEYDLRVNNSGNMSNGITSIQSMYAPEFSSHSEGVRVSIE